MERLVLLDGSFKRVTIAAYRSPCPALELRGVGAMGAAEMKVIAFCRQTSRIILRWAQLFTDSANAGGVREICKMRNKIQCVG